MGELSLGWGQNRQTRLGLPAEGERAVFYDIFFDFLQNKL